MKLAYPAATPESNVPLMGFCGSFEKNLDSIQNMGYTGIELLVRNPAELSLSQLENALEKRKLTAVAFGTSPMLAQDKLSLLSENQEIREEAFKRAIQLIDLSSHFNSSVIVGKFRGNISKDTALRMEPLNEIFFKLCDYCEKTKASILLEPQKYDNINNLNTIDESLEWLQLFRSKRLKLLVDTFHMNFTEKNQCESIRKAAEQIGFVHLSDSDRMPPGCGSIDFTAVLNAFEQIGYNGFFSMEIKQHPSSEEVARISINNIIRSLPSK